MRWEDVAAVLFDLDGTLVDSVPDLALAVDRMLAELGRAPAGEAKVREWVGNGSANLVKRALTGRMDGDVEPGLLESALTSFFAHYESVLCFNSRLYDGVEAALADLNARDLALAVVTNKPERFTLQLLETLGLAGRFAVVVGGDTLSEKKPHPAPLLYAAARLGVTPEYSLMVGDSRNDVEAARRAGMRVVCVPYGYNHGEPIALAAPDAVVENLSELAQRLNE